MAGTAEEIYAEVATRDGTLRGMLHRPPNFSAARRYPAVMMWHGFTGARVESHRLFVYAARHLAANGIITARFDFIGSGESDGEYIDVTPESEVRNAQAVSAWIQAQAGVDRSRLGLIGLSLGGLVAVCTAARSGNVKALCLWAATAHFDQRMQERATPEGLRSLEALGYVDLAGTRISRDFLEVARQMEPLREAANFRGEALIIHGAADPVVPVLEAYEFQEALAACNPTLHIMPEADHTFNRWLWQTELIETTTKWLSEKL